MVFTDRLGARWVELDTGAPKNALNVAAVDALIDVLDTLPKGIRAVVLYSRQAVFSAGWDLRDETAPELSSARLRLLFERIAASPVPLIGWVSGLAVGLSVGLIAACDVVVASDQAKFSLPESRVGLLGAVASLPLAERIRARDIGRMLMFAERISADEALRIGLVDRVVPDGDAEAVVEALLQALRLSGPGSVGLAKMFARRLEALDADARRSLAEELTETVHHSAERQEGLAAFFERRPPAWAVTDAAAGGDAAAGDDGAAGGEP
jgi:enoyl-CoA hydratase/carnithine racemase